MSELVNCKLLYDYVCMVHPSYAVKEIALQLQVPANRFYDNRFYLARTSERCESRDTLILCVIQEKQV